MQHLLHDGRYTIRSLARVPVLSATIVLTVGLGLGATAAMVGAVWAVLVNPLPYADPGSLVWIYTDSPPNKWSFSVVDYRALERSSVPAWCSPPRASPRALFRPSAPCASTRSAPFARRESGSEPAPPTQRASAPA